MAERDNLTQELILLGQRLYVTGIIRARAGNLSARLPDGSIVITRSRTHKGLLQADDFLLLDPSGQPLEEGTPSSEVALHVAAYQAVPELYAVGHAHPLNCTELAHREQRLLVELAEEGVPVLGTPSLLPLVPRDQQAVLWAEQLQQGNRAALLMHHGLVVAGVSAQDVLNKMELAEWIADLQLRLQRVSSHGCACVPKP